MDVIPDYQTLMRPVLELAVDGEVRMRDAYEAIADAFDLTDDERAEMLPSGRQRTIANRVHWAKTYLKQAGLVRPTRRGHFTITDRGRAALADGGARIDTDYLKRFEEFRDFQTRSSGDGRGDGAGDNSADLLSIGASGSSEPKASPSRTGVAGNGAATTVTQSSSTPNEILRRAFETINESLAEDLIERVLEAEPAFFEQLIVTLLIAMGYGGSSEEAGRALGRSGDDGVDGVIDQDPLGVDQVYIQAKRYAPGNAVGARDIRDFFGALNLKRASKDIFVTTSSFTQSAIDTTRGLGQRIVLIDGHRLAQLMIRYNVGCREEEVLRVKKVDEEFFEG